MENSLFNLHTHTTFCDGKAQPEEFVDRALGLGFHTLGFSSHAPLPFENNFSISPGRIGEYRNAIEVLRERYKRKINILVSLEMDYIPGMSAGFRNMSDTWKLDYMIGGVHLIGRDSRDNLWLIDGPSRHRYDDGLEKLFSGDIRKAVGLYYEQVIRMATGEKPDIIAHFDKVKMHNQERYFSENESWYRELVWNALNAIRESGCILEVNTRGLYKKRTSSFFPSAFVLERALHLGIPVTVSSDAHRPEELDLLLPEAYRLLREVGFKEVICFRGSERVPQAL